GSPGQSRFWDFGGARGDVARRDVPVAAVTGSAQRGRGDRASHAVLALDSGPPARGRGQAVPLRRGAGTAVVRDVGAAAGAAPRRGPDVAEQRRLDLPLWRPQRAVSGDHESGAQRGGRIGRRDGAGGGGGGARG